jgi:hypothetical protein
MMALKTRGEETEVGSLALVAVVVDDDDDDVDDVDGDFVVDDDDDDDDDDNGAEDGEEKVQRGSGSRMNTEWGSTRSTDVCTKSGKSSGKKAGASKGKASHDMTCFKPFVNSNGRMRL